MTILAIYKVLLYGAIVLIAVGLPALETLLNWKYPLGPEQEERRRLATEASRSPAPVARTAATAPLAAD